MPTKHKRRGYGAGEGASKFQSPIVLNSIPRSMTVTVFAFFKNLVPYKLHEAMIALITPTFSPARMYDET